jgi:thiol-disulfide isomerase/thioredoxin
MELLGPDAFAGQTLLRPGTWAIDFSADWCPYCTAFLPNFATLEEGGALEIAVADLTDLESPLWDSFEVEVVPTVILFKEGKVIFRANGRSGEGLDGADLSAVRAALAPRGGVPSRRRKTRT